MNKQEALKYADLLKAFGDGKQLEVLGFLDVWHPFSTDEIRNLFEYSLDYIRVKPENL